MVGGYLRFVSMAFGATFADAYAVLLMANCTYCPVSVGLWTDSELLWTTRERLMTYNILVPYALHLVRWDLACIIYVECMETTLECHDTSQETCICWQSPGGHVCAVIDVIRQGLFVATRGYFALEVPLAVVLQPQRVTGQICWQPYCGRHWQLY